jgi:hypothetical protein
VTPELTATGIGIPAKPVACCISILNLPMHDALLAFISPSLKLLMEEV